ncbi:MAG: hypothetical protein EU547_04855 [Promethearchaeota archaeon]|nr:MAG: hypothetical protein EU547_04855 [Candidatus Lokiarchaeota archaeon]
MKKAKGRITEKTSGNRGYKSTWLYIPSDISKDEAFPFRDREKVIVELKGNKLIIRKSHAISEITKRFGISDATLSKLIEKRALDDGKNPFLYFKDKIFSYQKTNSISNQIAHGITDLVKDLDLNKAKIALLFPNCPESLFTWFGIAKTKNILVPISYTLKGNLLEYVLRNSNAELLIIDYQYYERFTEIQENLPKIRKIIIRNAPEGFKCDGKLINFKEILSPNKENPIINIKNSDPLEIMYTAGTTGKPKGILYRNYYTLSGISVGSKLKEFGFDEPNHKIYCPMPLFQGFTKYFIVIPALYYKTSVIIADYFNVGKFWKDIKKYNPNGFSYYGAFFLDLMHQEPKVSDRKHSLDYAFGFGASKKGWGAFERRFGLQIIEGWSLREGIGFTINPLGSKGGKTDSVGLPARGYEIKIIGSNGKELPPGRNNIGEIVSRIKLPIKLEYYNLELEPDTKISDDRWVHTGDYGYRDSDGYIYFLGRKSDMFKRSGEIFFASDIERVANSHPLVINSGVVEVELMDEESMKKALKIWVKVKEEGTVSCSEFHSYLKENLAYFMVPRYIELRKELPKNANEFVQKFILKEEWEEKNSKYNTYDAKLQKFLE